jgi:hypothetical protein
MRAKLLYLTFILIFVFSLGMIVWTVVQTSKSNVGKDNDEAFLSTYQDVDRNYNKMVIANQALNEKYDIKFTFNDTIIDGLSHEDIFLAQRAVELRKIRKDILVPGLNNFKVSIKERSSQKTITNADINMVVTMATTHEYDKELEFKNNMSDSFELINRGFWNITGSLEIDGVKGHFFIKTNSK